APRTLATMAKSPVVLVGLFNALSRRPSTSPVSRIWGMALGDTKLPKSSRSKPTSRSSFMYAALVAVGIKRCMPCIASRGHSVIDTLAAPLPCACDRGTSTIVLIDLHGKWQPCLDTPQLQRRFCLLIIAVVHTELALAEPRAYPVG